MIAAIAFDILTAIPRSWRPSISFEADYTNGEYFYESIAVDDEHAKVLLKCGLIKRIKSDYDYTYQRTDKQNFCSRFGMTLVSVGLPTLKLSPMTWITSKSSSRNITGRIDDSTSSRRELCQRSP